MANHLTNPPLNEKTRRPKENGQTRPGSSGTLLWLDPLDGTWSKAHIPNDTRKDCALTVAEPAVLHNNIRGKLIRKASRGGPYSKLSLCLKVIAY